MNEPEPYQMHTPQCRHVIKWELQNASLTNTEYNELFEEAKQHLTIMRKYLNKSFRPFEIALKLGHSENIIQDVFHRIYFQNQNWEVVSASKLIDYACTIELEETLSSHKANQYAQFSSIIQELNQLELLELKQENIELVMRSLCRICASRNSDLLLRPCNHRAACFSCYTNTVITNCPLCNNFVQDSITISRNDNIVVPQPESTPDNEPHCLVAYILN